jgi:hypothetical protein
MVDHLALSFSFEILLMPFLVTVWRIDIAVVYSDFLVFRPRRQFG